MHKKVHKNDGEMARKLVAEARIPRQLAKRICGVI